MTKDLISVFIQEMINEANLLAMPEDFKQDYMKKIRLEIEQRLGKVVISKLSKEDIKKFSQLMDKEDLTSEDTLNFFNEHIDNFSEILENELKKFKQDFVDQSKKLEKLQQAAV